MPDDIPVKISETVEIDGVNPIVLIGPNGSGKTRHAVKTAQLNNGDLIAALRNLALSQSIPSQPLRQATHNLRGGLKNRLGNPWELSNEIDQLFSKLIAEDAASAVLFRDQFAPRSTAEPESTTLMALRSMWERLFPERSISFAGSNPVVHSNLDGSQTYPATQMSDGERVALYLAARVLDSESALVIIDEPEIHFHSLLAVRFWDELETLRPDCRFLYVTHDLPFALSRVNATHLLMKPEGEPEKIMLDEGLPTDLSRSLLAAASFSIFAHRVVFCEGESSRSYDVRLYSAWFEARETSIVPVSSGQNVIRSTLAFGSSKFVNGLEAIGIIDRDYWPSMFLSSLDTSINVLGVHEVENLFCLKPVFNAIAIHLGKQSTGVGDLYKEFMGKARARFSGDLKARQISERFRRRCEGEFRKAVGSLEVFSNIEVMEIEHVKALKTESWQTDPAALFAEEQRVVEGALIGSDEDFLRILPGKVFLPLAAQTLGLKTETYVDAVCSAIAVDNTIVKESLRSQIETCLEQYLPSRTHTAKTGTTPKV